MKGYVLALLVAPANADASNPLAKVLELMDDLTAKVSADGERADKAYKEYFEWCDDTDKTTRNELSTNTASETKLTASIEKLTADIEVGTAKIEDLAGSIAQDQEELSGASAVRAKENGEFVKAETELSDAVDTLDRAVGILEREMAKNPAAFAQVDMSSMKKMLNGISAVIDAAAFTASDRSALMALVQSQGSSDDEDEDGGAPAAAGYKSQSGGIVDILVDMKDKAAGELKELRDTEAKAEHNFQMVKQSLEKQISSDSEDLAEEKSGKQANFEQKNIDEADLAMAVKLLASGQEVLAKLHADCLQLAADHEHSIESRAKELAVIDKAKHILQESTKGASFLQTSATSQKTVKITSLIKHLAKVHHSAALAQLASRISAVMQYSHGADVFAKVKGLIGEMIAKLEKEANEDAKEKAYCDEEMSKTEAKKAELEDEIEKQTTKIDQDTAKSIALKGDVTKLQAELAAVSKQQVELDAIRADQNKAYVVSQQDLSTGLNGVQKALETLRAYYGGAALIQNEASFGSFMQQPAKPEMHGASSGAGGSIIDILEVVESDFSKNLATVEAEEADAVEEYETTTQENKITKATKEADVTYKTQEFKGLDKAITELAGDKETTSTELAAVDEYYAQIKDRCVAKPETFEERTARRAAEIAGLKQALQILNEETAAFVQRRSLRQQRLQA